MTHKHPTSSVFVFRRFPAGWRIGLIKHPRFDRMMIPGGHVEPEESCAEAALREVAEETGQAVTLVGPPAVPVPPGYRARRSDVPWWIAEYQVPPDGHLGVAHIHVDHLYVALADGTPPAVSPGLPVAGLPVAGFPVAGFPVAGFPVAGLPVAGRPGAGLPGAAHPFGWYEAADLPGLDMFDDARLLARLLLGGLAGGVDGTDSAAVAEALVTGLTQPLPEVPQP